MNTDHLQYVLAVARYRSINQAAEALHLHRPYLSRVVSGIEKQLGLVLFERLPKGVELTPEGAYALERIQEALAILDELTTHFAPSEACRLRCHDQLSLYSPTKMRPRSQLIQIMERYRQQFPNVSLKVTEKPQAELMACLSGCQDALAIVVHSTLIARLDWPLPEQLRFIPIRQLPVVALAAADSPLAQQYQSISLTSLNKQNLVLVDAGDGQPPLFYELLSSYGTPKIAHVVSGNMQLFYELLQSGRYVSLGIASLLHQDGLRQIPLREQITATVGLMFDPAVLDHFPAKELADIILEQFDREPMIIPKGEKR